MPKELIEYGNNIKNTKEEMKVTVSEIKKNQQGTHSGGDEVGTQINNLEHKDAFNQNSKKKRRFQKNNNKASIRSL